MTEIERLKAALEACRKENQELRKAARTALDWCTGGGRYSRNRDNIAALAEEVEPALKAALREGK